MSCIALLKFSNLPQKKTSTGSKDSDGKEKEEEEKRKKEEEERRKKEEEEERRRKEEEKRKMYNQLKAFCKAFMSFTNINCDFLGET